MQENPIALDTEKDKFEFRRDEPEKFLGAPIMKVKGFKREKDRIKVEFKMIKLLLYISILYI